MIKQLNKRCLFAALIAFLAFPVLAATDTPEVIPAELVQAWWVDGSEGLDISGLSLCWGELVAVADKASDRFYSLTPNLGEPSVSLVERARFTPPGLPDDQPVSLKARALHVASTDLSMDFEGVTCDEDRFYLLSERHNRLASLDAKARAAHWTPQRWLESAWAAGYIHDFNGGSEGLVKAGEDFWIALERNPRGLLRLKPGDREGHAFFQIPPVAGLNFRGFSEDVAGLAYYGGFLYTLERNAYAVCQRSLANLQANWCVTYRHIERAPEYRYRTGRFGKGEGLEVDERGIFVMLDNNGVARMKDKSDTRGLLLLLSHPAVDAEKSFSP